MTTLLTATPYVGEVPADAKLLIHRTGEASGESVETSQLPSGLLTFTVGDDVEIGEVVTLQDDGTVNLVGEVIDPEEWTYDTRQSFTDNLNSTVIKLLWLNTSQIVAGYIGNDDLGYGVIGTIDDDGVTWATPVNLGDVAATEILLIRMNVGKFIFAYTNVSIYKASVCAVSGTVITRGAESLVRGSGTSYPSVVYNDSSIVTFLCRDSGGNLIGYTGVVSTTTFSSITAAVNFHSGLSHTSLDSVYHTNQYFWIAYGLGANSYVLRATLSGVTLTWGTEYLYSAGAGNVKIAMVDDTHIMLAYIEGGEGKVRVGTLTEPVRLFKTDTGEMTLVYIDGSTDIITMRLSITDTTISIINSVLLTSSDDEGYAYAESLGLDNRILISYQLTDVSFNPFTSIRIYDTTTDADDWVGVSQTASLSGSDATVAVAGSVDSNQTGLTPGTIYYLSDNGVIVDTDNSRRIGRAMSATSILLGNG